MVDIGGYPTGLSLLGTVHVPGGQYYGRTKISQSKGERWFGTEAEARAAGVATVEAMTGSQRKKGRSSK